MRTKQLIKDLKKALQQDYLYNSEELGFMREQLEELESQVMAIKRKKPEGFGNKK
jgi:hypothetical protein